MCSVNVDMDGADTMRGLKVVKVIGGSTTNSSPVNDNNGSKNNFTVFNQRSPFDTNGVLFSTMQYLDSPSTTSQITDAISLNIDSTTLEVDTSTNKLKVKNIGWSALMDKPFTTLNTNVFEYSTP
jgi:hypothetical protein